MLLPICRIFCTNRQRGLPASDMDVRTRQVLGKVARDERNSSAFQTLEHCTAPVSFDRERNSSADASIARQDRKTGNLDCSVISKNTGRGLALQTRAICHLSRRKHARKWRKTNHLSTAAAPTMMGLALAKPGAKMPRGPNRKSAHSLVFLQEGPNVSRLR